MIHNNLFSDYDLLSGITSSWMPLHNDTLTSTLD